MRTLLSSLILLAVIAAVAVPASARRLTCEQVRAAGASGRSAEEVATTFATTTVRVAACARIEEGRQRHAGARARFYQRRAERGLAN